MTKNETETMRTAAFDLAGGGITGEVQRWTGRKRILMRQYIQDYQSSWEKS
jgi:hypothetical protein